MNTKNNGSSQRRSGDGSNRNNKSGFKKRSFNKKGGSGFSNDRNFGGKKFGGKKSGGRKFGGRKSNSRGSRGGGRKMQTFDPSMFINQNPVDEKVEVYKNKHRFKDFELNNILQQNIDKLGIQTPSPIQDQIIPEILNKKDVIGLAETGTGKTAAFLVPLINQVIQDSQKLILILAPTRELAIQVNAELMSLSKGLHVFSTTCVGGMNIRPQIKSLGRRNNFIIGTPGRVMDLIKRKSIKPAMFSTVVLDEADRMLDMGFINDMKSIISETPKTRQTLFFSATMTDQVEKIAQEFLNKPVTISVKKKDASNSIDQDVVNFGRDNKFKVLANLFKNEDLRKVIVFGNMKHSVEKLSKELNRNGIKSESIHGNKNHTQRQRALQNFKDEQSRVLVATDVAARGIHVDKVSHVINYDLPTNFDDYIHRIGRTGRGKDKGKALTFVPNRK
jgi:ATP-dependent RNA helicase RhlE